MLGSWAFGAEIRTALRAVTRRPASSLILIGTIALGIGATTAIFTVVDTVLLRPLPFHEPARIANIWTLEKDGFSHPGLRPEVADVWRDRGGVFSRTESFVDRGMLYRGADAPFDVRATLVSPGLFSLLGVRAAAGRTLLDDDATADAPNVAVVSDEFWRTRLGAARDAIGRPIVLDGQQYLVVGVMPRWFRYPLGNVAMWLPLKPGALAAKQDRLVSLVGRIRDDITPAIAQERVRQLATQLNASSPRPGGWSVSLFFLDRNTLNPDVRRTLAVVSGAVLCLLAIACANAANILLVRAAVRQRELAIRGALGATRATLVRQLVIESLLLASLGGLVGVVIAFWSVDLLLLIVPPEMSYLTYSSIGVDARVLAFATIASVVTGLLFGVGPAIRASRARATFAMHDRSGTAARSMATLRGVLIVGEVAVSLALLAGAGLFGRSFLRLTGVHPGFDAEKLLTAELMLPSVRYQTPEQRWAAVTAYQEQLRALPGVEAVSVAVGIPPAAGTTFADGVQAEGSAALNREMMPIPFSLVDTAFFTTAGIRILRGRAFSEEDRLATDKRAVIDPELARALWPNADAVGRRFRLGPEDPWITVVGLANDVKMVGPDDRAGQYAIYYPLPAQRLSSSYPEFALRMTGDPRRSVDAVKRAIWSVDPQQPIASVATARERLGNTIAKPRFLLAVMSVFAAVALLLAVVGLYGVLSHAVAHRTREIGIRMALGAQAGTVLRGVLGYGGSLTALGVAIGLGLTVAGGRVISTLLFGVTPLDPLAIAAAAALLAVAALVACYIPARRATRVDPLEALRTE